MDLTPTIAPKSDQLNADDLIARPRTVTVVEVRKGTAEQPVNIVTKEFGPNRPYKPSKSMRRVLVAAWGAEAASYPGRMMTLFRNPTIRFGAEEVGGIQISHMSHIQQPVSITLTISRGSRAPFIVRPLPSSSIQGEALSPWIDAIGAAQTLTQLHEIWQDATKNGVAHDPRVTTAKDARKAELTTPQAGGGA